MFLVQYCLIAIVLVVFVNFISAEGPDNQYLPPKPGGRPQKGNQDESGVCIKGFQAPGILF